MNISIITATFNAAATVADCLRSVASQTHPAEHIIIDGASTDNTLEIVKRSVNSDSLLVIRNGNSPEDWPITPATSHQSPVTSHSSPVTHHQSPITRLISEPDQGIYDAMNKGIALATGEVIGILNADDFYASPDVLSRVAAVFEDPEVMCCYGDLEYVREAGLSFKDQGLRIEGTAPYTPSPLILHPSSFKVVRYWKSGPFSPDSFYSGWMPPHPTFFVRRSIYERFGNFRLDMGSAADYELMLRLLVKHQLRTVYIPAVLVRMRVGGASNESLTARLRANRMDRRAWEVNGLRPYPWTLFCKPLRKVGQYVFRQS